MYQSNIRRPSLRSALLLGAASAAAVSLSAPAFAQQQQAVETVVVTGSRIPQQGLYASSPVTAVGQQELKYEGTTNVEDLLNNLPEAFADMGETASNGSSGTANVDLRGLGASRTLVLIDGKRLGPGAPDDTAADLNFIPAALIDHVEVLTGGASAVYGSDAVAGVVNFIMRKDFEGIELDGTYNIAEEDNSNGATRQLLVDQGITPLPKQGVWDGADADATLIFGANTADNKGNVTGYIGYRNIQPVLESTRNFSACGSVVNYYSSPPFSNYTCGGSATTTPASFTPLNTTFSYTDPKTGPVTGVPSCPAGETCTKDNPFEGKLSQFQPNAAGGYSTVPFYAPFNFAPINYLQRPDERYTGGFFAHYQVSKALDFFANFMFMDDHTVAQIAPSGLFYGTPVSINCDNPFLGSFADSTSPRSALCGPGSGLGPTDTATAFLGLRGVALGNRQDNLRHTDYRMVVGVKGDLGSGWSYELFGSYYTSIYNERYLNEFSIAHTVQALQAVDVGGVPTCKAVISGVDPNCVPINVFQPGGITQAALNYVGALGEKEGDTEERVVGGNITGDLGEWGIQSPWAQSPVGISVGTDYMSDSLQEVPDLEFTSGDLAGQGGPTPATQGSINVAEGFGEIQIPIVQGAPFFEDLTANAGYRYSDYDTAGNVSSYKYGFEWQTIDSFKLRGSYQRAVRAPNINELFFPQSLGLWGGTDPCASDHPTLTAAQCANTGVSASQYGNIIQCVSGQCGGLFGGNPNLRPETSDTWSVGGVFTPTFLDGFTLTVDYFNIKVKGIIATIPQKVILQQCGTTGAAIYCDLIHRAAGTGLIFGSGAGAGYITSTEVNTGFLKTDGIDFEANYQTDLSDLGLGNGYGSIAVNFLGTYLNSLITQPFTGGFTYDCRGLFGLTCGTPNPTWRHKMRVTWTTPWDVDVSVNWRHLSGVDFDGNSTDPNLNDGDPFDFADAHIPSYDYFDLTFNWTVTQGVEFRTGVTNIFDKQPPFLDSNNLGISAPPFGNGNTFPGVYDALGRVIFVGGTIKY